MGLEAIFEGQENSSSKVPSVILLANALNYLVQNLFWKMVKKVIFTLEIKSKLKTFCNFEIYPLTLCLALFDPPYFQILVVTNYDERMGLLVVEVLEMRADVYSCDLIFVTIRVCSNLCF